MPTTSSRPQSKSATFPELTRDAAASGGVVEGAQAHHVLPQKFASTFQAAGINIHDPKFGAWWEASSHAKNASAYNKDWERFLSQKRTQDEIFKYARDLAGKYGDSRPTSSVADEALPVFHLFGLAFVRGALHAKPGCEIENPFGVARGEVEVTRAHLQFEFSSGTKPLDLIGTEYPALRLLSARAIGVLRDEAATGWTSIPVELTGKKHERIEGYELLIVTGRSGPIDNSRSVKVVENAASRRQSL